LSPATFTDTIRRIERMHRLREELAARDSGHYWEQKGYPAHYDLNDDARDDAVRKLAVELKAVERAVLKDHNDRWREPS
jgi:hypothetical protein